MWVVRCLSVLVVFATCSSVTQIHSKSDELCTVTGRVVAADSGRPLKNAQVHLLNDPGQDQHEMAITQADGSFVLKDVAAGRYRFWATHNGYVWQEFKASDANDQGALLTLGKGDHKTDVLFRLTRAAAVVGRITDEDGEPVAGVEVQALMKNDPDEDTDDEEQSIKVPAGALIPMSTAVTNDLGEYRVYGLPPGDYYFSAVDSGDPELTEENIRKSGMVMSSGDEPKPNHPPIYYPGVLLQNDAETLTLRAGDETHIDFSLRSAKMVSISGRVVGIDGKPDANASVFVEPRDISVMFTSLRSSSGTDANGKFRIDGLSPGAYVVRANDNCGGKDCSAEQNVELGPDDLSLDLALTTPVALHGHVVTPRQYAYSRNSTVYLALSPIQESLEFGDTEVHKDGSFIVTNLHPGDYRVHVSGLADGWYLKAARLGGEDVLEHGLKVTPGVAAGTLELAFSPTAAQLQGTVVQNGSAVAGAVVHLRPEVENPYRRVSSNAMTDQYGTFLLKNVPPGRYVITASLGDQASPKSTAAPQEITLVESETKSMELEMKPAMQ